MFPLEFFGEVIHEETRVMGLSSSDDRMIVAWVVLTQCQRVTDGRTDRRIYGFTIANTALCVASMLTRCINRCTFTDVIAKITQGYRIFGPLYSSGMTSRATY